MTKHIMVDLETMGTGSFAAIASIGAVEFNPMQRGDLTNNFHVYVDPSDCQRVGMRMDWSTVAWWMDNDQKIAREVLVKNIADRGLDLPTALGAFRDWIESLNDKVLVWGNGATFDNVILRNAYQLIAEPAPWDFRSDRCFRTIRQLAPDLPWPDTGRIAHDALDDARTQALMLQDIVVHLGLVL